MCKNVCKLCDRLVISQSVTYSAANGIVINLPAGSYADGEKYCIVVAQAIPTDATIGALVNITIGTDTTLYPLTKCNCVQATACSIRTRTKYSTVVNTNATGGSFKLLGKLPCAPQNNLVALTGGAT